MAGFGIFSTKNYAGTDQGVDFVGSGQIPSLGSAVVTSIGTAHIIEGGSYPYVVYQLKSGPYKGKFVYTMESFNPHVHVGQHLRFGQSIGYATGNGVGIETGFNQDGASLNPVAPLYPNPHSAKPAGAVMWKYIQGLIGAAPKVTNPAPVSSGSSPPSSGGTGSSSGGSGGSGVLGSIGSAAVDTLFGGIPVVEGVGAAGGVTSTISSVGDAIKFIFSVRFLEVLGGGILVLMGIYLLARQVGLPSVTTAAKLVPGPVGEAASALPKTSTVGPSEINAPRTRRQVIHHYHPVGSAASDRNDRSASARPISDPELNEIPF